MNLTDDEILKFQRGSPVFLEDICAVYPATLGEIVDEGYSKFQQYLSVLTAEKPITVEKDNELTQLLEQLTDFQYILMMATIDPQANQIFRDAFRFFTHETSISFVLDPAQIVVGDLQEKHILNEENFYDFQRLLRRMYFLEQEDEEIIINKDDDIRTRKLKLQMRANREKLRKAKAKKARAEKNDLKFSDLIGSMPLSGCGLNAENIWNITYYMFHDQLKRSGWHEQFDINNRAAMAGAKLKKSQLKHWMRTITSSNKS